MGKISTRQVFWGVCITILVAVATGEHIYRRILEVRYEHALQVASEVEVEYATVLEAYRAHAGDLAEARHRSDQLSEALADRNARLDEALAKLDQEHRAVGELEGRLASAKQQLEQVQGELALSLDTRQGPEPAAAPDAVQLQRVIISDAAEPVTQGRVVSVHPEWNFIVVNMGWNLVKTGDTVSIFRNNELLAKARIERVQERAAAATILPDWASAAVQINDQVRAL